MKIQEDKLELLLSAVKKLDNISSKKDVLIVIMKVLIFLIESENDSLLTVRTAALLNPLQYKRKHPELINPENDVQIARDYVVRILATINDRNAYFVIRYAIHALADAID
jgi:hypothetical protein